MKRIYAIYALIAALVFAPALAFAVNVSIPQSTGYGQIPIGNAAGGSYTPTATSSTKFFTLTTSGSSGASTYSAGTLNIPQYTGGGASFSFTPATWGNATGTVIGFQGGFISNASSTISGTLNATGGVTGALTGNASTATALAANGTNCSAGNYPLGVDASGNAENCTVAAAGTVTSVSASAPLFSSGGATPNLTWQGLSTTTPWSSGGVFAINAAGVGYTISTTSLNASITGSAGSVANVLTINNSGSGVASGGTYNGSSATTISYNSIGAEPQGTGSSGNCVKWGASNTIVDALAPCGSGSGTFSFTPQSWGNATGTTIGFTNGIIANASSTFSNTLFLPALGTPAGTILAVNAAGQIIATTTSSGGVASVSGSYPIVSSGGTNPAISFIGLATTSTWTQGQLAYVTANNLITSVATGTISAGSSAITVTAGRAAVGGALAIDCAGASGSQNGCLSSTDWSTFNSKNSFAYPFINSATSSSLMILASTTIGDGTKTGGLTVNGTASTTNLVLTSTGGATTPSLYFLSDSQVGLWDSGGSLALTRGGNSLLWDGSAFTSVTTNTRDLGSTAIGWRNLFLSGTASTSNLTVSLIQSCSGSNALTTNSSGVVSCGAITASSGVFPFTPLVGYNATSTTLGLLGGFFSNAASSTLTGTVNFDLNQAGAVRIASTTNDSGKGVGFSIGTTTWQGNSQSGQYIASTTTSGPNYIVDWSKGNIDRILLSQNSTIDINATSSHPIDGGFYGIKACENAAGGSTLTFVNVGAVRWGSQGTTTIPTTANTCSYIGMQFDGLTSIYSVLGSTTAISSL